MAQEPTLIFFFHFNHYLLLRSTDFLKLIAVQDIQKFSPVHAIGHKTVTGAFVKRHCTSVVLQILLNFDILHDAASVPLHFHIPVSYRLRVIEYFFS